MSPPHVLKTLGDGSEEGELAEIDNVGKARAMDDFDSVFGETSPRVRRTSPRKQKDPVGMTRAEANDLIKEILSRRPPAISPTFPRLPRGGGLKEMDADPLDSVDDQDPRRALTVGANSGSSSLKEARSKRAKTKVASGVASKLTLHRFQSGKSSIPQESPKEAAATSVATNDSIGTSRANGSAGTKLKEYISMDTIEDWKDVLRSLEKTETIELAKAPRDTTLLTSFALLASWIADHLVDLIVKRIQAKCIVSTAEPPVLLSLATQISVLRETARQCYLRGHHYLQSLHASAPQTTNHLLQYQSLDQFLSSLCKL